MNQRVARQVMVSNRALKLSSATSATITSARMIRFFFRTGCRRDHDCFCATCGFMQLYLVNITPGAAMPILWPHPAAHTRLCRIGPHSILMPTVCYDRSPLWVRSTSSHWSSGSQRRLARCAATHRHSPDPFRRSGLRNRLFIALRIQGLGGLRRCRPTPAV